MFKRILLISFMLAFASVTFAYMSCTAVVVGKNATADGSVMVARNEDYVVNNWAKHMVLYPHHQNAKNSFYVFPTGLRMRKPAISYEYIGMPDWNLSQGPFDERGINENNVAVSATTSAQSNAKAQKADPFVKAGVDESVITTLLLSQGKTARQTVTLLGDLINQYGASEANAVFIADKNEAWVFEIGAGHAWLAARVPNDAYFVEANGLRLSGIDLTDTKNCMHSPKLFENTVEHHLLESPNEHAFDFAKAYGVIGDRYNTDRVWLAQHILSPSQKQAVDLKRYPLFLKPNKKIKVADVIRVLRATYKGTVLAGKSRRPIAVDRNLESHILQLRPNMPHELTGLVWQSIGNVASSVFIPFYASMTEVPIEYQMGTDQYDSESAYWTFRSVGALASVNQHEFASVVRKYWDQKQKRLFIAQKEMDQALLAESDDVVAHATQYSMSVARRALVDAHQLFGVLMTNVTKSTEKGYHVEYLWKEFEKGIR